MLPHEPRAAALRDRLPPLVGGCRLVRALGRGAMGTVFLGELGEDRPFARRGTRLAVKILHPELVGGRGLFESRLKTEAELGMALRHASVVKTYDAGQVECDGALYHFLLSEYVDGKPLRQLMDELGELPEPLLRDVGRQIAEGLAAIHSAGAVHRDLKPENILISADYRIKLVDLGIARLLRSNLGVTSLGSFVGSPQYAAPEQWEGFDVGPEADLYSLGVVLYEAASREQPFRGDSLAAIMRAHLERVPPPVRSLNPRLTRLFDRLLATLLQKEARRRLRSAAAVIEVLSRGESSAWWREQEGSFELTRGGGARVAALGAERNPLIGRQQESRILVSELALARASQGRGVLVRGEAGVGKTRLLSDFLARHAGLDAGVAVWYASAAGREGASGSVLSRSVLGYLGEHHVEERIRTLLPASPRRVQALTAWLGEGGARGDGSGSSPESLESALIALAASVAAERPLLWLLEDLHFAQPGDLQLLAELSRALRASRVLLLLSARPWSDNPRLDALAASEGMSLLKLDRLRPGETRALLGQVLDASRLDERAERLLVDRSDGNPFFALALLRDLQENGSLTQAEDGRWVLRAARGDEEVPAVLEDLVRQRLAGLSEAERMLLDAAAVQGFEFDADLIARVLGKDRLEVLQALARMGRRQGLVRATGSTFEFDHHLLREAVHADLPLALAAEYHARTADAAAARLAAAEGGAAPGGEMSVFLAEHYLRGGRKEAAVTHLRPALDWLALRSARDRILTLTGLALTRLDRGDASLEIDVLLARSEALDLLARREEQRETLIRAAIAAEASGDGSREARVHEAAGRLAIALGEMGEAREVLEKAVSLSRRAGDRRTEARALAMLGEPLRLLGDRAGAQAVAGRALAAARSAGDVLAECRALLQQARLAMESGDHDQARRCCEEAVASARQDHCLQLAGAALGNLGITELLEGRYAEARSCFQRQIGIERELGSRRGEAVATGNLSAAYGEQGDLSRAGEERRRAIALSIETGNREGELLGRIALGVIALMEGDLEQVERLSSVVLAARTAGLERLEAMAQAQLAVTAAIDGREPEGIALLEQVVAVFHRMGPPRNHVLALAELGRARLFAGDAEGARRHFGEASERAGSMRRVSAWPILVAYRSWLGEEGKLELDERYPLFVRAEARLVGGLAAGSRAAFEEGLALARELARHLTGPDLERFWKHGSLGRLTWFLPELGARLGLRVNLE